MRELKFKEKKKKEKMREKKKECGDEPKGNTSKAHSLQPTLVTTERRDPYILIKGN